MTGAPSARAQIGTQNQTWANWKSQAQPAAKFNIAGLDTCPMSSQCNSQQMQGHRLRTRQLHTFYSHVKA